MIMVKIYIDKGHGGSDPGAIANGLQEKDLTLAIGNKIEALLSQFENVEVKSNRSGDVTQSLKFRTDDANAWNADLYLSIHINAGGGTGYEDYRHTSETANGRSGQIQSIIHGTIMDKLRVIGIADRGIKSANFHVLRETHMPAMLSENLFIDRAEDAALLKRDDILNDIALGHVDGVVKAFHLKRKAVNQAAQQSNSRNSLHRVQVGAFSDRANAERLAEELRSKGYSTIIVEG